MKTIKIASGISLVGIGLLGTYMYIKMHRYSQNENNENIFQDYERRYINSMIRKKIKKNKS